MLLDLKKLVNKYKLNLEGVIHCGAHEGFEKKEYDFLKIPENNQHYIEPQDHIFEKLKKNVGENVHLYNCAVGSKPELKKLNIEFANNSQSSSFADFELHKEFYPNIEYAFAQMVEVRTLDEIFKDKQLDGEWLLNADLQSWELEMLKGAKDLLNNIKCVLLEVNEKPLYKDCPNVKDLDQFLEPYGFRRVETYWVPDKFWGDGFWIK